jgi:hypothetical protein
VTCRGYETHLESSFAGCPAIALFPHGLKLMDIPKLEACSLNMAPIGLSNVPTWNMAGAVEERPSDSRRVKGTERANPIP